MILLTLIAIGMNSLEVLSTAKESIRAGDYGLAMYIILIHLVSLILLTVVISSWILVILDY